jgi:hypothetical protein
MTASPTPGSVSTVGMFRLAFVPKGSNPLSLAILNGVTTKDITYSLTPGGWRPATTENTVSDGRFTQKQILNRKGNFSLALEVQYTYGATDDIAYPTLIEDVEGFIVVRESVDNAVDWALTQKADVFAIKAGKQRKDPPAENALKTITQGLYLTAPTLVDQSVVA